MQKYLFKTYYNVTANISFPVQEKISGKILCGFFCVLSFLFINPFLAIFLMALASLFYEIPKRLYILSAALSFTLFFYFREYGGAWAASSDDVPTYIIYFHSNDRLNFAEIFTRFFAFPSGTEPLWHLMCWMLINAFNISDNAFIFTQYMLLFTLLFSCFTIYSKRYFAVYPLVYFFLTPAAIDALFHIWRQETAFLLYFIGVGMFLLKGKKGGIFLVCITPFIHLVFLYFVFIFFIFLVLQKARKTRFKIKYVAYVLLISVFFSFFFFAILLLLNSLGLNVATYVEGSGDSRIRLFFTVMVYSVFLLSLFFFFKSDNLNAFIILMFFPVLGIMVLFPGANSIYDRLFYSILPLLGIYFYRSFEMNFSRRLLGLMIILIFFTGTVRLYSAYSKKLSCIVFLANGNFFTPSMGIVRLLSNLDQ